MPLGFPNAEFSPARKAASEVASQADELEGALQIATDILGNYIDVPLAGVTIGMIDRCERAAVDLCEIYSAFDEKSASEHAETLDYHPSDREEKIFQAARAARKDAIELIERLQAVAKAGA